MFPEKLRSVIFKYLKYKVTPKSEKKVFMGLFAMEPWLFFLITNTVLIIFLCVIGLWINYGINSTKYPDKLYGEQCISDIDCKSGYNYICTDGKCACSSTTYYDTNPGSFSGSCGKYLYFIKVRIL